MDDIRIRRAGPNDLELLQRFQQELIKAERPMDPTIRPDPVQYYDLTEMMADPETFLVVAEMEGRVVGSGYAQPRKARAYLDHKQYAYLGFMYTVPEFRGRGVNARVVDALSAWAFNKGLHELRLTVYHSNQPAIRAYEKVGFAKHIVEMRLRK